MAQRRRNTSLISRIGWSYIVMTAIPFLAFFTLISAFWWNNAREHSIAQSEKFLQFTRETIQTQLNQMDSMSVSLYYEPELLALLREKDIATNVDKKRQLLPRFERLFLTMSYIRKDVFNYYYYDLSGNLLFIYENGLWIDYSPQTTYNPVTDEWFSRTVAAGGRTTIVGYKLPIHASGQPIFSMSRLIKQANNGIGMVLLDFNFNILRDLIRQFSSDQDSVLFISDQQGHLIYASNEAGTLDTNSSFTRLAAQQELIPRSGSKQIELEGKSYLLVQEPIERYRLLLTHLIPLPSLISSGMNDMLLASVSALLVIVLLILSFLLYFRRRLQPLKELADTMDGIDKEPFDTRVEIHTDDELGKLGTSFNRMMNRIKELVETDYKNKLQLAETEKKMLEAQINPHFLYNTLDTIRFLSLEQGVKDIAKMLFMLSTNLRYTIVNTNSKVLIREEIEWLERYIYLQKLRFKDRFDVFFSIDVAILEQRIYRLILQPFIENAIQHGFRDIEQGGILHINGYLTGRDGFSFEIVDNGCGFPEPLDVTLTYDSFYAENGNHLGMYNAIQRLFLYYGANCEVYLHSIPGKRTAIRLTIKDGGSG